MNERAVILRPSLTEVEKKLSHRVDSCIGPSDSTAMGWKRNWVPRWAYLAVLRSAAVSVGLANPSLLNAAASRLDVANGHIIVIHTTMFVIAG